MREMKLQDLKAKTPAELVSFAERCGAATIYVTHGSRRFAEELRRRGIRAEFLRHKPQMRLF